METAHSSDYFTYAIQSSESRHATEDKIRGFQTYLAGWHFGEGIPYQETTINITLNLHKAAIEKRFYTTDAFPGLRGQIVLTIYQGDHYFEFTIEPDGNISLHHEINGVEISYNEYLSLNDAKCRLQEFSETIWMEYGLSAKDSMIGGRTDSRVRLLRTLAVAESPLLISSVSALQMKEPVSTSKSTILTSLMSQSSSGNSRQIFYQTVVT